MVTRPGPRWFQHSSSDLAPVGQAEEQREQFRRLAAATHHHEAAIEAARTRLRDLDIERERLTALVGSDGTADSPKDMGAVDTVQRPGMGAVDTVQRPGMAQPFRQPVIPPTVSSSVFIQPDGRTFETRRRFFTLRTHTPTI